MLGPKILPAIFLVLPPTILLMAQASAGTPAAAHCSTSPYISHYLCMIGQICDETRLLFCRCGMPWYLETRECLNNYRTTKVAAIQSAR